MIELPLSWEVHRRDIERFVEITNKEKLRYDSWPKDKATLKVSLIALNRYNYPADIEAVRIIEDRIRWCSGRFEGATSAKYWSAARVAERTVQAMEVIVGRETWGADWGQGGETNVPDHVKTFRAIMVALGFFSRGGASPDVDYRSTRKLFAAAMRRHRQGAPHSLLWEPLLTTG